VRRRELDPQTLIGLVIAGIGSIAVAVALVPFRSGIDNANLGLILVLVVVVAAIVGGGTAGALAAVVATIAFDFFLTRPYLSMRVDSADDVETVLVLLVVGLLVGEVAARGRRARRLEERAADAISRVHHVAQLVADGVPLDESVRVVNRELVALLRLHDCWLEFPPFTWTLPQLEPGGTVDESEHHWASGGFTLPADGVELAVIARGRQVARLILLGDPTVAVTFEERVVAVALANQLGSALAIADPADVQRVADEGSRRQ
jgi:K+-sensing histidine kinase KdpD